MAIPGKKSSERGKRRTAPARYSPAIAGQCRRKGLRLSASSRAIYTLYAFAGGLPLDGLARGRGRWSCPRLVAPARGKPPTRLRAGCFPSGGSSARCLVSHSVACGKSGSARGRACGLRRGRPALFGHPRPAGLGGLLARSAGARHPPGRHLLAFCSPLRPPARDAAKPLSPLPPAPGLPWLVGPLRGLGRRSGGGVPPSPSGSATADAVSPAAPCARPARFPLPRLAPGSAPAGGLWPPGGGLWWAFAPRPRP